MNNPTKTVKDFLKAVQTGNQQRLIELIHPDAEWSQPGKNRFSGIKKSVGEIFNMIGGMYEVSKNSLILDDIQFIGGNENEVACMLYFKATKDGGRLNSRNIDIYTVTNNKITRVKVFVDDSGHEDEFWGN